MTHPHVRVILWIFSIKWYQKDKKTISLILEERAKILETENIKSGE